MTASVRGLAIILIGASALSCSSRSAVSHGDRHTRVLFIGNSLTYTNDLPATLAALALQTHDTLIVESVTAPNLALIDHVNGATDARARIRGARWDFVVLQQGPTARAVDRDTLVLAAKLLSPDIRAAGARPALYMVWTAKDRPETLAPVRDAYAHAAASVTGILLPVGVAWQGAMREDASLALYGADGFHPAPLGTYLAALVLYEHVTSRDARALPLEAARVNGRVLDVDAATLRLLQRVAHDASAR